MGAASIAVGLTPLGARTPGTREGPTAREIPSYPPFPNDPPPGSEPPQPQHLVLRPQGRRILHKTSSLLSGRIPQTDLLFFFFSRPLLDTAFDEANQSPTQPPAGCRSPSGLSWLTVSAGRKCCAICKASCLFFLV
jgi:hypothetical protein